MSATTTEHTHVRPIEVPKEGHEWKYVERPADWDDEYYSKEFKTTVKRDCCWCGELFYGGEHEDGNHEGVWQQVKKEPKAQEPEKAEKVEEQEQPDVVEVPVFGRASDLGKRKVQEKPEQHYEVIDLTTDSEDELPDHELDLPKGKKARAQYVRDVDALVARICSEQ